MEFLGFMSYVETLWILNLDPHWLPYWCLSWPFLPGLTHCQCWYLSSASSHCWTAAPVFGYMSPSLLPAISPCNLASYHFPSPQLLLCLSSFFPAFSKLSSPYSVPCPFQVKQCLKQPFLISCLSPVDHICLATPTSLLLLEHNHAQYPDLEAPWPKLAS